MKKLLKVLSIVGFASGVAGAFGLTIDQTDSGSISVSSMTQILNSNPAITSTWIINRSTIPVFLIPPALGSLTSPTTIYSASTSTGSFYIQGSTSAGTAFNQYSPDGNLDPYRGPMWATTGVVGSTATIQRIRTK